MHDTTSIPQIRLRNLLEGARNARNLTFRLSRCCAVPAIASESMRMPFFWFGVDVALM